MTRSNLEKAEIVYSYLRANLNQPFTRVRLEKSLRWDRSYDITVALKHARDMAESDGLFLPVAVPANGFTYMVTDSADAVFDSELHLNRAYSGTKQLADRHAEYVKAHVETVNPADRPVVTALHNLQSQVQAAQESVQSAADDLVLAVIGARKERRDEIEASK